MFRWQSNQSARKFHLYKLGDRCFKPSILRQTHGFLICRAGLCLLMVAAATQTRLKVLSAFFWVIPRGP
jgi:hypothetical protein